MLNPEFWLDEEIAKLSAHARLLYMGLWGICDDHFATLPHRPDWIKVQVFPYEDADIDKLLGELEHCGKIIRFKFEGRVYFFLKNFFRHQKIDRPSKSKYPEYKPEYQLLAEDSTSTRSEVKIKEVKGSEAKVEVPPLTAKAQKASAIRSATREIINAFVKVDPKNKTYQNDRRQQDAAEFLIEEYTLEKVLEVIRLLPQTNKQPYFSKIFSPHDLKEKWESLKADFERHKRDRKRNAPAIIIS